MTAIASARQSNLLQRKYAAQSGGVSHIKKFESGIIIIVHVDVLLMYFCLNQNFCNVSMLYALLATSAGESTVMSAVSAAADAELAANPTGSSALIPFTDFATLALSAS